jgi:leucyl aminopeptidase
MPANFCTPMYMAGVAKKIASANKGTVKLRLMYRRELERHGFGAYLAVALASKNQPVFIELSYEPANPVSDEVLGFVGKSVTFDTGGADIKGAAGMRTMKCDMSGGAAVLGAFATIVAYKLPVRVKAFLAATDNMVDALMNLPGNVLTALNGLTIEVDNTDAEGRLTLADAIEWAKRQGVTRIVDVATLTGAMVVALGSVAAGAFGNKSEFTRLVVDSGVKAGERLWEMPMFPEYARANESNMADLKNSGGADFGAGSITAAWFVRKFAGEDVPWVHLDIAGSAFLGAESGIHPKGGTGFATRTLVALAEHYAGR